MRKFKFVIFAMLSLLVLTGCGNGDTEASGDVLTSLQEKGLVKVGFANEKPVCV